MKRLFFVRHGETEMNVAGVISGQTETSLTPKGIQQAKDTGKQVKQTLPPINLIICSPYERTCKTAEHIAEAIGYPVQAIVKNDLFVERTFGVLEATKGEDFLATHTYREIDDVEGSETIEELHQRAKQALAYLKTLEADNILVVSHGAFGRALRRVVNDLPHHNEYETYSPIGNAEVVELI